MHQPVAGELMEAALRALIRIAPAAVMTLDQAGRITGMNPAAERLFGSAASDMVGRRLGGNPEEEEAVPDFLHDPVLLERLGRGESVTALERRTQRKDGTWIDVSIFAASMLVENASSATVARRYPRSSTFPMIISAICC